MLLLLFLTAVLGKGCRSNSVREDYFRYNESAVIASLDPAFSKSLPIIWPVRQLYNTLLETDATRSLKPSLATSWTIDTDQKTIRFILRNDVYFHDDACFPDGRGRKMIASDVVYSFQRLMSKELASPGAWIFQDRLDSTKPFVAVNDTVFELRLNQPFSPMLQVITNPYCSVVPKEAVQHYGKSFGRHPVGTGPFRLLVWKEGVSLIMTRNPHYFERDSTGQPLPYLPGISISFLGSRASEYLAFQQGAIDFINDPDPAFKDEMIDPMGKLKKSWSHRAELVKHPYLNTEYVAFLMTVPEGNKSPGLLPIALRKAIAHSIDKKRIIQHLRNNMGIAADQGFVPPSLMGPVAHPVSSGYDTVLAKKILREAGYGAQKPIPDLVLTTVPAYASVGSRIVYDLQQVGISARLDVLQKSFLMEQMASGNLRFFRGSWIADYPDALNFFSVFYSKNPAPPNYTRFQHADFDRLFERAMETTDWQQRAVYLQQLNQIIEEEVPIVPIWYDQVIWICQRSLSGFVPNAQNVLDLRRVKKQ
ncbi:MAG: ABC transporter substrate-binding protein [Ferruginibacter sp.]